jgi:hypothetical protein
MVTAAVHDVPTACNDDSSNMNMLHSEIQNVQRRRFAVEHALHSRTENRKQLDELVDALTRSNNKLLNLKQSLVAATSKWSDEELSQHRMCWAVQRAAEDLLKDAASKAAMAMPNSRRTQRNRSPPGTCHSCGSPGRSAFAEMQMNGQSGTHPPATVSGQQCKVR